MEDVILSVNQYVLYLSGLDSAGKDNLPEAYKMAER